MLCDVSRQRVEIDLPESSGEHGEAKEHSEMEFRALSTLAPAQTAIIRMLDHNQTRLRRSNHFIEAAEHISPEDWRGLIATRDRYRSVPLPAHHLM